MQPQFGERIGSLREQLAATGGTVCFARQRNVRLARSAGQLREDLELGVSEIGEAVRDDQPQVCEERRVVPQRVASRHVCTLFVDQAVRREQLFILGEEISEFLLLPRLAAGADRAGERRGRHAIAFEFGEVLNHKVDERRMVGHRGQEFESLCGERRSDHATHQSALLQGRDRPGRGRQGRQEAAR